jgi:hypothetical protein
LREEDDWRFRESKEERVKRREQRGESKEEKAKRREQRGEIRTEK